MVTVGSSRPPLCDWASAQRPNLDRKAQDELRKCGHQPADKSLINRCLMAHPVSLLPINSSKPVAKTWGEEICVSLSIAVIRVERSEEARPDSSFPWTSWHARLLHAQRHLLHRISWRPAAVACHRPDFSRGHGFGIAGMAIASNVRRGDGVEYPRPSSRGRSFLHDRSWDRSSSLPPG